MSAEISVENLEVKVLHPGQELEDAKDDIWNILQTVDMEFRPSLSSRNESQEKPGTIGGESLWGGPIYFFETMMDKPLLMAYANGKAIGLLSFIPNHTRDDLAQWSPSTYIWITAVLPKARRLGVATTLNDYVEHMPSTLSYPFITRRTWSTNESNITLLKKRGFEEVIRWPDHRGPGIDTIYFARKTVPDES